MEIAPFAFASRRGPEGMTIDDISGKTQLGPELRPGRCSSASQ